MSAPLKETAASPFPPMSVSEMRHLGWKQCDFVLVSGDAYVDHPSFGAAVIVRSLEAIGMKVGIIAQPDWKNVEALRILARPRLGFLITSGNMDSMVNHYTAARKLRHSDAYSPGGAYGRRPDRALIVYANLARRAYKGVPVIIGGIEASLRRTAHYDYWSDKLRRSIMLDTKADLLIYGMAERTLGRVARSLDAGKPLTSLRNLRGVVYKLTRREMACRGIPEKDEYNPASPAGEAPLNEWSYLRLPSFEDALLDKKNFARSFALQMENADPYSAAALVEPSGEQYVIQNPPDFPLSREELDAVYELPYVRTPHPSYREAIPALKEVRFSLVSSRGCFGGCTFCALTFHQGRIVQGRSHDSLLREAGILAEDPEFKGYIHDVGGPTANFRGPACERQKTRGACPHRQCLFPDPCPMLSPDHQDYIQLLRKMRKVHGVKKVFVRSGIRFDYLLLDQAGGLDFLRELCAHHVSGQLKIAPEHISDQSLSYMGKAKSSVYRKFMDEFKRVNRQLGKKQYLVPYFIAAHPGSTLKDAVELAEFCRDEHFIPQQVQEFYPTPGTVSTCMYYTGIDPRSMKPVSVPRGDRERRMHKALMQYNQPGNYRLVKEALEKAGRRDLIGKGPKALIPQRPVSKQTGAKKGEQKKAGYRRGPG